MPSTSSPEPDEEVKKSTPDQMDDNLLVVDTEDFDVVSISEFSSHDLFEVVENRKLITKDSTTGMVQQFGTTSIILVENGRRINFSKA